MNELHVSLVVHLCTYHDACESIPISLGVGGLGSNHVAILGMQLHAQVATTLVFLSIARG